MTTVIATAAIIAALYFGRGLLVPLALATLLAFALSPVVTRLRRVGLGRVTAVLSVVALAFVVIGGISLVVTTQVVGFANELPRYEQNLRQKIRQIGSAEPSGGVLDRVRNAITDLEAELARANRGQADADDPDQPIPVEITPPAATPLETIQTVLGPIVGPVGTAALVLVFVIFMLIEREELRNRFIRLLGTSDLSRTTELMTEAAERVSRYLLMQVVINVTYGIPVAVGLWLIGVPNPLLWGLLCTLLRFVPYVGPALGALCPILLSFALEPGFTVPLLTIGLFVLLELFSNNVMEPWLYGSSTGLTPVAIIVAALFWTSIWGPVGLLLATPLTVCLVVLGRHVPQLQFFDILLGSDSALPVDARIYQRLLAGDPADAAEQAEDHAEEHGLLATYDEVLVPVLSTAEHDRQRGAIGHEANRAVATGVIAMLDELREVEDSSFRQGSDTDAGSGVVLCVAGRNEADRAVALMLADLLHRGGLEAEVSGPGSLTATDLAAVDWSRIRLVVLSYVAPSTLRHVQRSLRRLQGSGGRDVPTMVGVWNTRLSPAAIEEQIGSAPRVVMTLDKACRQIDQRPRATAPQMERAAS